MDLNEANTDFEQLKSRIGEKTGFRVPPLANDRLASILTQDGKMSALKATSDSEVENILCSDKESIISGAGDKNISISTGAEVEKLSIMGAGTKRLKIILAQSVEELNIMGAGDQYLQIISGNPHLKINLRGLGDKYVQIISNNPNINADIGGKGKQEVFVHDLNNFLKSNEI